MDCQLQLAQASEWNYVNGMYLWGRAYNAAGEVTESTLENFARRPLTRADFIQFVRSLTGHFAVIYVAKEQVMIAVDHIRSKPLFYASCGQLLFISDSAETVRRNIGDSDYSVMSRDELLLSGYVIGSNTLYPNVKQVRAGEVVIAMQYDQKIHLTPTSYFHFKHKPSEVFDTMKFALAFEQSLDASIDRLIHYAGGRPILLPLSGGYDSRLIASALAKRKYPSVTAFSYGRLESREAQFSRQIASALGFKWVFVPYTRRKWRKAWHTPEAEVYRQMGGNYSSLPHFQDWLAVKELVQQDVFKGAVVVPGHCAVTNYIPSQITDPGWNEQATIRKIFDAHFTRSPIRHCCEVNYPVLQERIRRSLSGPVGYDADTYASTIMEFNWRERQAKYITNSVRVYESFGLSWWLPLWDRQFLDIWESVPLSHKIGRRIYIQLVNEYFRRASGAANANLGNALDRPQILSASRGMLLKLPLFLRNPVIRVQRLVNLLFDPLAWLGVVGIMRAAIYSMQGYKVMGIFNRMYLHEMGCGGSKGEKN